MSGKKKAQKMSLSDFLADDNGGGSWADEMASLPSAPAAREEPDMGRGGDRFGRDYDLPRGPARGDRYERPADGYERRAPRFENRREEVELPTEPPFNAYVGNLPFDITEDDVADFFGDSKIAAIRLIADRDGRPKGFGYVEFDDLEGLKLALDKSGQTLNNRTVRVSVAEPPKERPGRPARVPDRTDVSSWRRETPLELPERRSSGGFRGRSSDRSDTSWGGGAFARRDNRFGRDGPSERPRLNLKPRTVDAPSNESAREVSNKPNPFGAARPVDTNTALKRIEEKLHKTTLGDEKTD
ncbi:hypothetical protein BX666DRAFT_1909195 [Dichotomocladium elegans]|nr:hypothetical protein BX666DRAFT_1909195 [Dichotomocladium elegans]